MSSEGKDLIKRMLEKDYKKRISAVECLGHPWFNKYLAYENLTNIDENEATINILSNMKSFTGRLKMQ